MSRLFISFSGGETSGMMTILLLNKWRHLWDEITVVFANTGRENEATLRFVDQVSRQFSVPTVWVEAVVHPKKGAGTTHRVVDFASASRNGEPFEEVIRKYGIPNAAYPHCTRELKLSPMYSFIESLGWKRLTYDVAVGIRADEPHRREKTHVEKRIIYPLLDWQPTTKPEVNQFWNSQSFRLELCGYQGNCIGCWKKSARKLLTIMDDDPRSFDFFERMEKQYDLIGPEFAKGVPEGYRRRFYRKHMSVQDLRDLHRAGAFDRAEDDALILPNGERIELDFEPGERDGCSESCEVKFGEELHDKT